MVFDFVRRLRGLTQNQKQSAEICAICGNIFYFFKNALNKSIGSGRNVVVLCSLAISRIVWR